ncbi:TPA: type II secretion system F family protein [Candidatus Poribacteria bacterium]|nr:type II secretion system F family protein [Candidatus Poribacteria bacterium]
MPRFKYQAMTKSGSVVTGSLEAENPTDLISKLRASGYYAMDVSPDVAEEKRKIPFISFMRRVKASEVEFFSYQLSTLINAGVRLTRALAVATEQITNPIFRDAVDKVRYDVEHGSEFYNALAQHKNVFSDLYINIVKAGETGGVLGLVLARLAEFSEKQRKLKSAVISALFYPAILVTLGTIIGTILMLFVIPRLSGMFAEMGAALPMPTRILMAVTGAIKNFWWIILAIIVIAVLAIRRYAKTESGKRNLDRLKLKLPLAGNIFKISAMTRFARTLGTLLDNGVLILPSLAIVRETVGNTVYRDIIANSEKEVERGETLSSSLQKSGEFPGLVTHMLAIGEEAGRPQDMLLKLSEYYEAEMDKQLERVSSLIGPVMILVMALAVGFLVAAAVLPIFEASNLVTG